MWILKPKQKQKHTLNTKFQVNVPGTPTFQVEWENGLGTRALQVCIFIKIYMLKIFLHTKLLDLLFDFLKKELADFC